MRVCYVLVAAVAALILLAVAVVAAPVTYPVAQPAWYNDSVPPGTVIIVKNATLPELVNITDTYYTSGEIGARKVSVYLNPSGNTLYYINFTFQWMYPANITAAADYDGLVEHWYVYVNGSLVYDTSDSNMTTPVNIGRNSNVSLVMETIDFSYDHYVYIYFHTKWVFTKNTTSIAELISIDDNTTIAYVRAPQGQIFTSTNASNVWCDEAYIDANGTYMFQWARATRLSFYNETTRFLGNLSLSGSWGLVTVDLSKYNVYLPEGDIASFNASSLIGNKYMSDGREAAAIRLIPAGEPLYTITIASYSGSSEVYAVLRDRHGHIFWAGYTTPTQPIYARLPYLEPFSVSVVEGSVEKVIANLVADSQLSKTVYIGFSYRPTYIGRVYLKATLVNATTLRVELTAPEPVTANVTVYKYNGTSRVEVASIVFAEPATAHVAYVYLPEGDPFFEVVGNVTGENVEGTVRTYAGTSIPQATAPPESIPPVNATSILLRDLPSELYALGPNRIAVWFIGMMVLLVFAAGSMVGLGLFAAGLAMMGGGYLLGVSSVDYAAATALLVMGAILMYTKREE